MMVGSIRVLPLNDWARTNKSAQLFMTLCIVLDIEYPRFGLIRVDAFDEALVEHE